jgi:hypothetical protein
LLAKIEGSGKKELNILRDKFRDKAVSMTLLGLKSGWLQPTQISRKFGSYCMTVETEGEDFMVDIVADANEVDEWVIGEGLNSVITDDGLELARPSRLIQKDHEVFVNFLHNNADKFDIKENV